MSGKLYVARSTAIAARSLGDETMVMSAADSTLFTLNEVATMIWQAADGATPLEGSAAAASMPDWLWDNFTTYDRAAPGRADGTWGQEVIG